MVSLLPLPREIASCIYPLRESLIAGIFENGPQPLEFSIHPEVLVSPFDELTSYDIIQYFMAYAFAPDALEVLLIRSLYFAPCLRKFEPHLPPDASLIRCHWSSAATMVLAVVGALTNRQRSQFGADEASICAQLDRALLILPPLLFGSILNADATPELIFSRMWSLLGALVERGPSNDVFMKALARGDLSSAAVEIDAPTLVSFLDMSSAETRPDAPPITKSRTLDAIGLHRIEAVQPQNVKEILVKSLIDGSYFNKLDKWELTDFGLASSFRWTPPPKETSAAKVFDELEWIGAVLEAAPAVDHVLKQLRNALRPVLLARHLRKLEKGRAGPRLLIDYLRINITLDEEGSRALDEESSRCNGDLHRWVLLHLQVTTMLQLNTPEAARYVLQLCTAPRDYFLSLQQVLIHTESSAPATGLLALLLTSGTIQNEALIERYLKPVAMASTERLAAMVVEGRRQWSMKPILSNSELGIAALFALPDDLLTFASTMQSEDLEQWIGLAADLKKTAIESEEQQPMLRREWVTPVISSNMTGAMFFGPQTRKAEPLRSAEYYQHELVAGRLAEEDEVRSRAYNQALFFSHVLLGQRLLKRASLIECFAACLDQPMVRQHQVRSLLLELILGRLVTTGPLRSEIIWAKVRELALRFPPPSTIGRFTLEDLTVVIKEVDAVFLDCCHALWNCMWTSMRVSLDIETAIRFLSLMRDAVNFVETRTPQLRTRLSKEAAVLRRATGREELELLSGACRSLERI